MDEGNVLNDAGLKGELVEVSAAMFTTLVVQQTASDALARAADSSGVAEARVLAHECSRRRGLCESPCARQPMSFTQDVR